MYMCDCYAHKVQNPPPHTIRCLKDAGPSSLWLIHRPSQELRTLKRWLFSPSLLAKYALGISQPQRQVRGANRAARAGIITANIAGKPRFIWKDGVPNIELELDYIEGCSALDALRANALSEQDIRSASRLLGQIVAKLAVAGLFHRDMTLSNIIIAEGREPIVLHLIDTVGIRPMRRSIPEFARMLERLAVQPTFEKIDIPSTIWMPLLLEALRPLAGHNRRGVLRWLKEHRQL